MFLLLLFSIFLFILKTHYSIKYFPFECTNCVAKRGRTRDRGTAIEREREELRSNGRRAEVNGGEIRQGQEIVIRSLKCKENIFSVRFKYICYFFPLQRSVRGFCDLCETFMRFGAVLFRRCRVHCNVSPKSIRGIECYLFNIIIISFGHEARWCTVLKILCSLYMLYYYICAMEWCREKKRWKAFCIVQWNTFINIRRESKCFFLPFEFDESSVWDFLFQIWIEQHWPTS